MIWKKKQKCLFFVILRQMLLKAITVKNCDSETVESYWHSSFTITIFDSDNLEVPWVFFVMMAYDDNLPWLMFV